MVCLRIVVPYGVYMFNPYKKITRKSLTQGNKEILQMPNLLDVQLSSYESFLQRERLQNNQAPLRKGIEHVFQSVFPIESPNGDMRLEYGGYILDEDNVKHTEEECRLKGYTYAVPLKARISLVFLTTGEIRQKDIYMGEMPLMTDAGSFIINGAERVVVSQMHRSPGVVFSKEKGGCSARIIPNRGSWLEFEVDTKKNVIFVKIDKRKKILATVFLRVLGIDTREKIIRAFYKTQTISIDTSEKRLAAEQYYSVLPYYAGEGESRRRIVRSGEHLHPHILEELSSVGITEVEAIDMRHEDSLHSHLILQCFSFEEAKYLESNEQDDLTKQESVEIVYESLNSSDSGFIENAEREVLSMFFSPKRYDLGPVGRYKLNKKFEHDVHEDVCVLTREDVVQSILHLIRVFIEEENIDDIDHLGNRRVRSVGELIEIQLKAAFANMERIAKSRMELRENDTVKPQDLIAIKYIVSAIKDFFGVSQLAQFMDQVNPLAEVTHKRRLNALGPGGVSRERAGFEIRDVHYTHYGRMCPIETPEGPNIGLIVSLANYARVNEYGFLETPYRKVIDGVVTDGIEYLAAGDEEKFNIAQASALLRENGEFEHGQISVRNGGEYTTKAPREIQYMDVSPRQIISISASLIPFLEHDDANRALMGSNMQRQAVPLLFPEPPRVGTGMEAVIAHDSGIVKHAREAGEVTYVDTMRIEITSDANNARSYNLLKYFRTNQDTCCVEKPLVRLGQQVKKGQPIADGAATHQGELSLGRNVLVGFMPWNGHNFEDAILISESIVKDDRFTSIHLHEFTTEVRETKFGPETVTPDIPNTPERARANLTASGVVRIGAYVSYGDILVGKVTPKSDMDNTPEFKLLNQIFGEKAREVRDTSLRIPHGIEGVVIAVKEIDRSQGDDLNPGVTRVVKVTVATKQKLKDGDKMAGRHGNKGVIARVVPEEDMPFMPDGRRLEMCLNPLGVPSRMNIGQLLELQLSWGAVAKEEWYATPVFESISPEEVSDLLEEAGLPRNSKLTLYDGKSGEAFKNDVTVGYMYMLKLHHLVDDKMHARSTGPYSLVTQQPLGGKAQFGGQRFGEMEVWALEAYGAANTLQELLTIKSDDINGRTKIYESIVKGDETGEPGVPESFNVLVQELRGLGLDLTIQDVKGKYIPLTERDKELLARHSSEF